MAGAMRTEVAKRLGLDNYNDNKLLNTIKYLEDKGFLEVQTNLEDRVTTEGVDEVENGFPNLSDISEDARTKSIGILNKGRSNTFIGNIFTGLDVGIQDEGEDTHAIANKFEIQ